MAKIEARISVGWLVEAVWRFVAETTPHKNNSDTVDGSEILHPPVGVGSLSHYLPGFIHPKWCRISSTSSNLTINQHNFPIFFG